eukprot:2761188-Pyramimonas_sp.AAC.1
MAQGSSKRGPREPQDGSKSGHERSQSDPRGVQEAMLELPGGGLQLGSPTFLADVLHNCPKSAPAGPSRAPRR